MVFSLKPNFSIMLEYFHFLGLNLGFHCISTWWLICFLVTELEMVTEKANHREAMVTGKSKSSSNLMWASIMQTELSLGKWNWPHVTVMLSSGPGKVVPLLGWPGQECHANVPINYGQYYPLHPSQNPHFGSEIMPLPLRRTSYLIALTFFNSNFFSCKIRLEIDPTS